MGGGDAGLGAAPAGRLGLGQYLAELSRQGVGPELSFDSHGEGFAAVGDDVHPSNAGVSPDCKAEAQGAECGDVGGVVSHVSGWWRLE